MMKIFLVCVTLMVVSQQIQAELIESQIDCPNGGTRTLTGNYNPITGVFDLQAVATDCTTQQGMITNGSITAVGTFKIATNGSQADVDIDINYEVNRSNAELATLTQNICQRTITGTYEMQTGLLDGSSTSNCEKSGKFYAPILELAAGFDELESIDKLRAEQQ
ncbi:MAG: hypothetical protein OEX82_05365 [Nitrosomonas sp.]|nr:hypothetical protein [Nitrosomonas sp.]